MQVKKIPNSQRTLLKQLGIPEDSELVGVELPNKGDAVLVNTVDRETTCLADVSAIIVRRDRGSMTLWFCLCESGGMSLSFNDESWFLHSQQEPDVNGEIVSVREAVNVEIIRKKVG